MVIKLLIINFLTLIRIIGVILLVPIYKNYGSYYVGLLALICYLTDSLDGLLARKWKASTFFGALFDSVADKLFTIMNFIVLYLITPYALIPIVFEIFIIIVQLFKYKRNLNIKSNIIGKCKVWILAICVVLTFFVSDINSIAYVNNGIKNMVSSIESYRLYFYIILPAIIMEALTLLSYLLEVFIPQKISVITSVSNKEIELPKMDDQNKINKFKKIWLNPEFYKEHKDDNNLRKLTKLK